MHIDQMRRASTVNIELLRNYDNYNEDLQLNDPTSTGAKGPRLLNNVEHFHVATNYMHLMSCMTYWKELVD